jgi:hypothetical protein
VTGTVEAICDPACSWLRKDAAAPALACGLADAGGAETELVELDALLQAVATRPRPAAAVRIAARCLRPTVLPLLEGLRPPGPLEFPPENDEVRSGDQT